MSFTLPTIYANATKQGNIQENWIVQLYYDDLSAFTPIALSDTTVGGVFYPGVISSSPTIRTSIDLSNSTAKTNNVSLNVINFKYKGDDFSAELFLGSRKYINRTVKIYSQLNGNSTLSNCFQIYNGRLIDISHDDSSIKLTLTEQRSWDFITIPLPTDKTTLSKVRVPVVYGNFIKNDNDDFQTSKALYPAPLVGSKGLSLYYAAPRLLDNNTNNEGQLHFYQKTSDTFIAMNGSGASVVFDGVNCRFTGDTLKRGTYYIRPTSVNTSDSFTDTINIFDEDLTSYASKTLNTSVGVAGSADCMLDFPSIDGRLTEFKMRIKADITLTGGCNSAKLRETSYAGSSTAFSGDIITRTSTGTTSTSGSGDSSSYTEINMLSGYTGNDNTLPPDITLTLQNLSGGNLSCKIYDYYWVFTVENDNENEPVATGRERSNVLNLYLGSNGLTESWSGSNGAIEHGHEAHRDMLIRYTGYTTTEPENWSALHTDRHISNWTMRFWETEAIDLKKVLEKIQYEFGFIFKFRPDGTGSYIYIKQTSELSAVQTLNKHDISNLKINNTPFSELQTKMVINYQKHPAENKYLNSVTSTNSTARTNWNIQAKENISEVNLDMNIGTPNSSGQTDPNSDFYSYYDNIFGDIKKIITCDIINPAKGYNLETGDIIQFSNSAGEMPVEPFGDNWADYYMITDLQRGLGTIKIQAREVG